LTKFAVPLKEVCKGVLSGKTIASNIVAIDLKTSIDWISSVLDTFSTLLMVSSPEPKVIEEDVTAVDLNHDLGLHITRVVGTTYSGKEIVNSSWILSISSIAFLSKLEQGRGLTSSSLKEKSRDFDTVNIGNFNGWGSIGRNKSGKTNTENDSVGLGNLDGFLKIVLTRLEQQMEALIKLCVDGGCAISILGNVNFTEVDFLSVRSPVCSVSNLIRLKFWDHELVRVTVSNDVWLLNNGWGLTNTCGRTLSCTFITAA